MNSHNGVIFIETAIFEPGKNVHRVAFSNSFQTENERFFETRSALSSRLSTNSAFSPAVESVSLRGSFSAVSATLQLNTRLKALDGIYKIYVFLHRSDLNISGRFHEKYNLRISRFVVLNLLFLFCDLSDGSINHSFFFFDR